MPLRLTLMRLFASLAYPDALAAVVGRGFGGFAEQTEIRSGRTKHPAIERISRQGTSNDLVLVVRTGSSSEAFHPATSG
jgi:hypothetical protein